MKKIMLIVAILFSTTMADSVLLVKKGWQLIGSSTPLEDMSKFKSDSVEEVWHFDALTQKWLGYSPDSEIQAKMSENNISKLESLENWHGFWVKSKKDWGLILDNSSLDKAPSDANSANDTVQLKEGWNLISLPVDSVLSADIFKDMTVWKYNPNQEWELFDQEQSQEDFPRLGHIKNSDGIWVKAPKDTNISVMQEASKLHNFATTEEMEVYVKEMASIYNRPYCGIEPFVLDMPRDVNTVGNNSDVEYDDAGMPTAETNEAGAEIKDATGTNLQESGVDEADIVKHDGVNIFYVVKEDYQNNYINITTFSELAKGNSKALDKVSFDDNRDINSLYLVDNRLVVISHISGDYKREIDTQNDTTTSMVYPDYDIQQIGVDIFDVSDINDIKTISGYKVDGNMVTSRVIGDNMYLVSSFSPRVNIKYPKVYLELSENCKAFFDNQNRYYDEEYDYNRYAECYNIQKDYNDNRYYREDYENPIVEVQDLLPEIEDSDKKRVALITPSKLYAPSKRNQSTNMTTISNITISDGKYQKSNSFIGYSSVQYASSKALYLVSNQYPIYYDFNNYKERSSIYKFNLDSELDYRGIGSVYGHTNNQFGLSEHNDILRMATTEGFSWGSNGTNNSIYTMKEQDGLLPIQGVLSGLGKEGETIKSVRFMGERAFIVTFRQTDPLYTIDMSDPKAPKKVGELEVNGYSAYLHPVGDDMLLGIGRDADSEGRVLGLKIELFDISDFANPTSLDDIIYGEGTSSELEYNHKALAYRASDNLFAFPYRANNYENYYNNINNLGVYQIRDNQIIDYKPINGFSSGWGEQRGLIFDMNDTTYISFFANDTIITDKLEEK
ncbi:hypothetical protein GSY74_06570 [Sulfurovum sp. bin170]|uniref:beta-propeller domain-containing protein n=1 Tax=Sulfurovum sp. bin170 TaxID=2695268 RepID=UPI0013DFC8CE|nr:beta-propeller domain-containing protein [Sulfurovum sp. bin170]NEW60944.1 hypothetical protein [Sulfurovum sp. bin170]